MLQEFINMIFILTFYWEPSHSSLCYLLTGLYLWASCTYFAGSTRLIYKTTLVLSSTFLVLKSLVILNLHFSDYFDLVQNYPSILESFAINSSQSFPSILTHLIPDAVILLTSLLGYVLAVKHYISLNSQLLYRYLGVILLWLCSSYMLNIPSLLYSFTFIYWLVSQGVLLIQPNFKVLTGFVSLLAFVQVLVSLSWPLAKMELTNELKSLAGIVLVPSQEAVILLLLCIVASNARRDLVQVRRNSLAEPLLQEAATLKMKFLVLGIYFLLKVGLFLWVEFSPGFTGLILILCTGFLILKDDVHSIMTMVKIILLPLLIISFSSNYMDGILSDYNEANENLNKNLTDDSNETSRKTSFQTMFIHSFMLFTIMLAAGLYRLGYIIRHIDYSPTPTWYGKILSVIISHTYLFSLIVLFTIGLSDINLLHTGLMILCLIYMSDIQNVKLRWKWLIYYMIIMMFLREFWTNLKNVLDLESDGLAVKIIGLGNQNEDGNFTIKDGLNWVLIFCCSLQQFANRYNYEESLRNHSNFFFDMIENAYQYFSNIEFWLIYAVLIVTSFFKDANILNFIRCCLILIIIIKHLSCPYTKVPANFAKLNPYLRVLKTYCMALLAVRYIYQFLRDYKQIIKFEKLGLEVYDQTQDLYYSTALDTILVVSSVLAHRSNTYWKERHDNFGTRKSDVIKIKAKAKESGKFRYSLFYNIFSRPFQYILMLTVGSLCIFWKLSVTMFVYLMMLCVYQLRISYSFFSKCAEAKNKLDEAKVEMEESGQSHLPSKLNKPKALKDLWISEWKLRAELWRQLFTWTISCIIMSYIRYFSAIDIVNIDSYLDGIYLFIGYDYNPKNLIFFKSFGYFIIFAMLVIERQCLQYNMPKDLKTSEDGWIENIIQYKEMNQITQKTSDDPLENPEISQRSCRSASIVLLRQRTMICQTESFEDLKKKIHFISALNLIKVIAEVIIPASLLILAIYKLTIISTVYVFCVFSILFLKKRNQTIVLNFVVVFCIFIQYGLILSNMTQEVSPSKISSSNAEVLKSIYIPWKDLINLEPKEQEYFNLGTDKSQLQFLIFDISIQVFVLIYWFYLSKREVQLTYLQLRVPDKSNVKVQHESNQAGFKAKVKMILYEIKLLFYKFARFSIVIIVLFFSSQNNGVLSLLYVLFCLIFLYYENLIIYNSFNKDKVDSSLSPDKSKSLMQPMSPIKKLSSVEKSKSECNLNDLKTSLISKEENNKSHEETEDKDTSGINYYLNLLKYFLRLQCFDLLFQIVVQIPLAEFEDLFKQDGWFTYLGVYRLSVREESEVSSMHNRSNSILFKILTFSILLVVEAMMKSRDFQISHKRHCQTIQIESEKIAEKITHEFNRLRVQTNHINSKRKLNFQEDVNDLEKNIEKWNEMFKDKDDKKKNTDSNEKIEQDENRRFSKEILSTKMLQKEKVKSDEGQEKNFDESENTDKLKKAIKKVISISNIRKHYMGKEQGVNLGIKFHKKVEDNNKNYIIKSIVQLVNKHLFEAFIRKVTVISSTLSDRKKFMHKAEKFNKLKDKFYRDSDSECSLDEYEEEEKLDFEENNEIVKDYEYEVKLTDYPQLICYFLASNTQTIVYFLFILNHFHYASLVSLVFPLSLFGYAMLEFPRPRMKYFRIMLIYTSCVLFIKFVFQLEIQKKLDFLSLDEDRFNIGFKCVSKRCSSKFDGAGNDIMDYKNSYDPAFLDYMLYDALVLFALLCREYYMLRIGMWDKIETDRETLAEAKVRLRVDKKDEKEDQGQEMNVSALQSKASMVFRDNPDFFERLIPKNPGEKPGRDFYLFTFLMQMVILIYLFFFFNKLDGQSEDISQSLIANQFQGRMVISVVIVVILIIFDRYVYIQHTSIALNDTEEDEAQYMADYRKGTEFQKAFTLKGIAQKFLSRGQNVDTNAKRLDERYKENYKKKVRHERAIKKLLIIKLVLHSILLIVVHGMVFWYFTSLTGVAFYNDKNLYLQIFYVLYIVYLTFESQQFRFGLPSFTEVSFPLMRHISVYSSGVFKIYKGMPFLYELRTVIDWTFTKTSLNIYQWFKLEEIQTQLFYNEVTQKGLKWKKHGDQIQMFEKIQFGACSLFIMLTIILLPLFIFSTLNPIVDTNKVINSGMNVNLKIEDRVFTIYSLRSAYKITSISESDFEARFNDTVEWKPTGASTMQRIDMPESADLNWDISRYTEIELKNRLRSIISDTDSSNPSFMLQIELFITRKYPLNMPKVSITEVRNLTKSDAEVLYNMIDLQDGNYLTLKSITHKLFRLPSAGDKIIPLTYTKNNLTRDVNLTLLHDDSGRFWNVSSYSFHDKNIGLRFYILSDSYSPVTFNFSILTFYISIVYFMGRIIRMVTVGNGLNIVMTDMKNCEHLRTLCSAIFISRMTGKFLKEEELYYELIDILRSPEFTKVLTGSSSIKVKKD